MAITLGAVTFDDKHTTVREKQEEVGGRNERQIEIVGVILGESSLSDVESKLDAIADAASEEDYSAVLSVRAGRRLLVRRESFVREVARESLAGSFALKLAAKDPFEEASSTTNVNWTISISGATKAVSANGNVFSRPTITLVASGAVVNPSFSDGTRTIAFSGTVADGETLVLDAVTGLATLEDEDVTPYSSGLFPRISPEGTTLTYEDDDASSHAASVTVGFRDRWW
ncbi:MAG TPA: hypothetical protein HPP83_11145 [Candidatus Hydrogenedentes bacterium]|nr:hypothetical protein [Candidatus Hydrogenedentota bacterium]